MATGSFSAIPHFWVVVFLFFTSICLGARRGLLLAALFIPFGHCLLGSRFATCFLCLISYVTSIFGLGTHDVWVLRFAGIWAGIGKSKLSTGGVGIRSRKLMEREGLNARPQRLMVGRAGCTISWMQDSRKSKTKIGHVSAIRRKDTLGVITTLPKT